MLRELHKFALPTKRRRVAVGRKARVRGKGGLNQRMIEGDRWCSSACKSEGWRRTKQSSTCGSSRLHSSGSLSSRPSSRISIFDCADRSRSSSPAIMATLEVPTRELEVEGTSSTDRAWPWGQGAAIGAVRAAGKAAKAVVEEGKRPPVAAKRAMLALSSHRICCGAMKADDGKRDVRYCDCAQGARRSAGGAC